MEPELMLVYFLLGPWEKLESFKVHIQENAFENVVIKLATIWSRPRCVQILGQVIHL